MVHVSSGKVVRRGSLEQVMEIPTGIPIEQPRRGLSGANGANSAARGNLSRRCRLAGIGTIDSYLNSAEREVIK